jgi:hypothetical protein
MPHERPGEVTIDGDGAAVGGDELDTPDRYRHLQALRFLFDPGANLPANILGGQRRGTGGIQFLDLRGEWSVPKLQALPSLSDLIVAIEARLNGGDTQSDI